MKKLLLCCTIILMYCLGCQKHAPENTTFTMDKGDTVVIKPPRDTIPIIVPPDTTPVTPTNCDTTHITYSITIKTIIDQNCASCHNGNGDDDDDDDDGGGKRGIQDEDPLLTYSDLVDAIDDEGKNKFMRMIRHTGGHVMPPSYKMTDCQIRQIEIWIEAGMPNN